MIERMIDILARRLDLDPAEVRRRNFIREFPHTTPGRAQYDSGNYERTLDRALELSGYERLRAEQHEGRARGRLLGIGLSAWVEVCGFGPSDGNEPLDFPGWESATLRLHPTGKATIVTGTSPHGQGHATTFAQIVETELGIPFEDVELVFGDTAFAPYGVGTHGSRSAAVGGSAVVLSSRKVLERARVHAAHLLEAAGEDLAFDNGRFFVAGSPDRAITIQEVAGWALSGGKLPPGEEPGLEATTFFNPSGLTYPFGCHVCVVEVDPGTGAVEIVRYLAVDDFGTVINPLIVDGQVHGGIVQSIAQALFEETLYDEQGQNMTATLVDYLFPSAADLPAIETAREVTPTPLNPLGVKGAGEAGTIAATPAVVNAVCDALDVDHLDMPLRPERVWRAVRR
jgi:carbon-monoxide dehydrogenase large subunit